MKSLLKEFLKVLAITLLFIGCSLRGLEVLKFGNDSLHYYYGENANEDFHNDFPHTIQIGHSYSCEVSPPQRGKGGPAIFESISTYLIPDNMIVVAYNRGSRVWKASVRLPYPGELDRLRRQGILRKGF